MSREFIFRERQLPPGDPRALPGGAGAPQRPRMTPGGYTQVARGQVRYSITPYVASIEFTDSVQVLPVNPSRRVLIIQNAGDYFFGISFDGPAPLDNCMMISTGQTWEAPMPTTQAVYCIKGDSPSAGVWAVLIEGV